jgi:hypothetical protein
MISVFAVSTTYEFSFFPHSFSGKGCIEEIRDVESLSFLFLLEIQFEWSGNRRLIEDSMDE